MGSRLEYCLESITWSCVQCHIRADLENKMTWVLGRLSLKFIQEKCLGEVKVAHIIVTILIMKFGLVDKNLVSSTICPIRLRFGKSPFYTLFKSIKSEQSFINESSSFQSVISTFVLSGAVSGNGNCKCYCQRCIVNTK